MVEIRCGQGEESGPQMAISLFFNGPPIVFLKMFKYFGPVMKKVGHPWLKHLCLFADERRESREGERETYSQMVFRMRKTKRKGGRERDTYVAHTR